MSRPVVILHGWSDTRRSFVELGRFLRSNGRRVLPVFLGQYVSLEDHLTVEDLAKAFVRALEDEKLPLGEGAFDLIVHSTGALVAREWLTRYYLETGKPCPVAHFLMLAPANFGSPLAHKGRSMFGRVVKGWKTGFQTGTRILQALEMGSPYTWRLAERDLFAGKSFYRPDRCMAAVIVGTAPYDKWPQSLVNKKGSDGTVYVSTANLNASRLTISLGRKGETPKVVSTKSSFKPIAFAALTKLNHGTITKPTKNRQLGDLIRDFLAIDDAAGYTAYRRTCDGITAKSLPPDSFTDIPDGQHSYENIVTFVRDDLDLPVPDYFLEFYEANGKRSPYRGEELMVRIHNEILESVHPYGADRSYRSLIFDITDLDRALARRTRLVFSVAAAPVGGLIEYSAGGKNDVGELHVPSGERRLWRPNETLLAEIVIQRLQKPSVFRLYRV